MFWKFLKNHHILLLLILLYGITRLINLTLLPIFNDEAIYLDWGWRELHGSGLFYSLFDGKQPLLMWVFGFVEKWIENPLLAGRLVSVVAGFFTLFGIYTLTSRLFKRELALLAAFFYIIIPLFSFYDRQALMESAVSATIVWSLVLFLTLIKHPSVRNAILLGSLFGLSFSIKSNILLCLCTYSVLLILVSLKELRWQRLWAFFLGALYISEIVLLPLLLQNQFWQTLPLDSRYTFTLTELLAFPIVLWLAHVWATMQIAFWQLTPLIFLGSAAGILVLLSKRTRENAETTIVVLFFLLNLLFFVLFVRSSSVRYLVPFLPLSTIFAAVAVWQVCKTRWRWVAAACIIFLPLFFLPLQLFSPLSYFDTLSSVTSYSEKSGYVTGWTAGYATTAAKNYLAAKIGSHSAVIGVRLDAGNPENAMFAYFHNKQHVLVEYFGSGLISPLTSDTCLKSTLPFYFVSRDRQLAGMEQYLEEEKRFYNPEKQSFVSVYCLKEHCSGKTLWLAWHASP